MDPAKCSPMLSLREPVSCLKGLWVLPSSTETNKEQGTVAVNITDKQVDRAPLCYRSTERGPVCLARSACGQTVASLPHNTTGNTYHSVYWGRKYYFPLVA